ncbi:MAG: pirin family protein [Bacteroidota bacterium]
MSGTNLVIEERSASIGTFTVGRLLPFRQKRMIGPFIYLDHMGPVKLVRGENFDVLPHPHIGLSTLTYLLEGSITHRDSIGSVVEIKPGEVNWMTAGRGIVHSERTPGYLRHEDKSIHGLQIWVALPKELEQAKPEFFHIEKDRIPFWNDNNLQFKLIAGEAFGRISPVPVYSRLFLLQVSSTGKQAKNLGNNLYGEAGIYILEGNIIYEENTYGPKQLLVIPDKISGELVLEANTTIFILGGEPFPEERLIDWNFVSTSRELIETAKQKWHLQEFDKIGGETEFVPHPFYNKK